MARRRKKKRRKWGWLLEIMGVLALPYCLAPLREAWNRHEHQRHRLEKPPHHRTKKPDKVYSERYY